MPAAQASRRPGVWTSLADQALADYRHGKVTVLRMPDRKTVGRMLNGIRIPLRQRDPSLRQVIATEPDGQQLRVYLRLVKRSHDA